MGLSFGKWRHCVGVGALSGASSFLSASPASSEQQRELRDDDTLPWMLVPSGEVALCHG